MRERERGREREREREGQSRERKREREREREGQRERERGRGTEREGQREPLWTKLLRAPHRENDYVIHCLHRLVSVSKVCKELFRRTKH